MPVLCLALSDRLDSMWPVGFFLAFWRQDSRGTERLNYLYKIVQLVGGWCRIWTLNHRDYSHQCCCYTLNKTVNITKGNGSNIYWDKTQKSEYQKSWTWWCMPLIPNTWEEEAGEFLGVWEQPGILVYIVTSRTVMTTQWDPVNKNKNLKKRRKTLKPQSLGLNIVTKKDSLLLFKIGSEEFYLIYIKSENVKRNYISEKLEELMSSWVVVSLLIKYEVLVSILSI